MHTTQRTSSCMRPVRSICGVEAVLLCQKNVRTVPFRCTGCCFGRGPVCLVHVCCTTTSHAWHTHPLATYVLCVWCLYPTYSIHDCCYHIMICNLYFACFNTNLIILQHPGWQSAMWLCCTAMFAPLTFICCSCCAMFAK